MQVPGARRDNGGAIGLPDKDEINVKDIPFTDPKFEYSLCTEGRNIMNSDISIKLREEIRESKKMRHDFVLRKLSFIIRFNRSCER
jgi:hypothetical protein